MPALYPSMVAPENFLVGDCVRKFVSEWNMTPFIGTVTQVVPATYKVWVQWPIEHSQESPENLVKVNPLISGMPTAIVDQGYSSYEKTRSEKSHGHIPKRITPSRLPVKITATDKMVIRIAHGFASDVIGKLVDDISGHKKAGLSDVQAYVRASEKFSNFCSDHIIRESVNKVYEE